MSNENSKLSRAQLCRKYRITEATLRTLEKLDLVTLAWEARNGQLVCSVTDEDDALLQKAPLHVQSFGARRLNRVPFQRFLYLRFLQADPDDILYELYDRNLAHPKKFNLERINALRDEFLKYLSDPLRDAVEAFDDFSARKDLAPELSNVLSVCEIELPYNQPELEQSFTLMTDEQIKHLFDAVLSTKSTMKEVQSFIQDIADIDISIEGLLFYQVLFHDVSILSPKEIRSYLKSMKPSVSNLIGMAVGTPLEEFKLRAGVDDAIDVDKTIQSMRTQLAQNLIKLLSVPTPDDQKEFYSTLKSFMLLVDRGDRRTTPNARNNARVSDVFGKFRLQEGDVDQNLFQLPAPDANVEANDG